MASGKITVKAGANGPVFLPAPVDGHRTIGDEPVELETSRYLRGRIAAGDLVEVVPPMPGQGVIISAVDPKQKDEE